MLSLEMAQIPPTSPVSSPKVNPGHVCQVRSKQYESCIHQVVGYCDAAVVLGQRSVLSASEYKSGLSIQFSDVFVYGCSRSLELEVWRMSLVSTLVLIGVRGIHSNSDSFSVPKT